jgi:hypothetical protein
LLDPLLSPEHGTDNPVSSPVNGGTETPAIAFDGTNYVVVWSDCREGGACGVWLARANPMTGGVVDPAGIPVVDDGNGNFFDLSPHAQGIACETTRCLITWEGPSNGVVGVPQLEARFFSETTGTVGPSFTISNPGDNWDGGAVAFNGTNYLVGYSLISPGVSQVVGNIVTSAGVVGSQFTIATNNGIGQHRNPALATDGTNFYAVWTEQTLVSLAYHVYVYGQGIKGDGSALIGAQTAVTPTSEAWDHGILFEIPAVAWDGVSKYVVAWPDGRAGGSNEDIWARRVSQTFAPDSTELQITSDKASQHDPALAMSGSNLLAAWTNLRSGTSVFGQLLTSGASLALSGSNFSIASTGGQPSIASNGGDYAIAYSSSPFSSANEAYLAALTTAGSSQFAPERMSNSSNAQLSPTVAFDGTNFLAVWEDFRHAANATDIFGTRIAPDGTILDPTGIAISTTPTGAVKPKVSFNGTSYLVVFFTDSGLEARRVNPDGAPIGVDQSIPIASGPATPSDAIASDGKNFIVLVSVPVSDFAGSIAGAIVDPNGGTLVSPIKITTDTTDVMGDVSIAYNPGAKDYLAVWTQGFGSSDVFGQRVTPGGAVLDGPAGVPISNAAGTQRQPAVAFDGTNWLVVFSDNRSGTFYDVYGNRVSSAGVVLDGGPGAGVLLSPSGGVDKSSPAVSFDGTDDLVVWNESPATTELALVKPDLSATLSTFTVATGVSEGPQIASSPMGQSPIAYVVFRGAPDNSFRVRIRFLDEPPIARCQNRNVSAGPTCTASASVDNGSVDADGDSISLAQAPPGPYGLGATPVTLTVSDSKGDSSSCSATVTVVDTTPPLITCPPNQSAPATSSAGATVTYTSPTVTDNCAGATSSCSPPSGSIFPIGKTNVICTATDSSSNASTCSFNVSIEGAPGQISDLIALVMSFGLNSGLQNSLLVKLQADLSRVDKGNIAGACGSLQAFINEVNAKSGTKFVTPDQASQMVSAAGQIMSVLRCP